MFIYADFLLNNKTILKLQRRFKIDCHNVYTEEKNKVVLSSNYDKRLQTFDKFPAYPYGVNAFKVCESEMLLIIDYYKHHHECFLSARINTRKSTQKLGL